VGISLPHPPEHSLSRTSFNLRQCPVASRRLHSSPCSRRYGVTVLGASLSRPKNLPHSKSHPNPVWIDPYESGLFLGQARQYCGNPARQACCYASTCIRRYESSAGLATAANASELPRYQRPAPFWSRRRAPTACDFGPPAKGRFGSRLPFTPIRGRDPLPLISRPTRLRCVRIWLRIRMLSIKPRDSKMAGYWFDGQTWTALATYLETLADVPPIHLRTIFRIAPLHASSLH